MIPSRMRPWMTSSMRPMSNAAMAGSGGPVGHQPGTRQGHAEQEADAGEGRIDGQVADGPAHTQRAGEPERGHQPDPGAPTQDEHRQPRGALQDEPLARDGHPNVVALLA